MMRSMSLNVCSAGTPGEGLGGEGTPELLIVGEQREPPLAVVQGTEPPADRRGARAGAVELERRAVAALFVEVGARDEQRRLGRGHQLDPAVEGRVARIGVDVDRPPPRLLDDRVAARVEVVALERQ